jgi:hypothetical protein
MEEELASLSVHARMIKIRMDFSAIPNARMVK